MKGGRGLKGFRLLPSASGTDDFTFEVPEPAMFVTAVSTTVRKAKKSTKLKPGVLVLFDCEEGADTFPTTIVLVRFGRVWTPKPRYRIGLLGSYTDPETEEPGVIYASFAGLTSV